jgi:hypothetical protein
MPLPNNGITSPRAGSATRSRPPTDLTGTRLAAQRRELEAKQAAAAIDPEQIRKAAHAEGVSAGWDAAIAWVIETYGLDADEVTE